MFPPCIMRRSNDAGAVADLRSLISDFCIPRRHIATCAMSAALMLACALSAVAFDVTLTADEIVGTNTTYDNQSVLIDGAGVVVTLDGAHTFSNLCITNGAMLTHSQGTTGFSLYVQGDMRVASGASVDVDGNGWQGGLNADGSGPGGGVLINGGASHGGLALGASKSNAYGSLAAPVALGSGGGGGINSCLGGNGGGAVYLEVAGCLDVDGSISANGKAGTGNWPGGGGSGGSLWLTTGTLAGSGTISANGGGAQTRSGGAGRIAIVYGTNVFAGAVAAHAADSAGGAGTVFWREAGQTHGELVVDNADFTSNGELQRTPVHTSTVLAGLVVRGEAELTVEEGVVLTVTDNIELNGGHVTFVGTHASLLGTPILRVTGETGFLSVDRSATTVPTFSQVTIGSGGSLSHRPNTTQDVWSLRMAVTGDMSVASGASVNVDGNGYQG